MARPLYYSQGRHNSRKLKSLLILEACKRELGPRGSLSPREMAYLTGQGEATVRVGLVNWVRWGYARREGVPGCYRYRLGSKGAQWLRIARDYLPRVGELTAEVIQHQRRLGLAGDED